MNGFAPWLGAAAEGLLLWLACLVYFFPLTRREQFPLRIGLSLAGAVAVELLMLPLEDTFLIPVLVLLLCLGIGELCWRAETGLLLYLGVWAVMTYLLLYELWEFLCFHQGMAGLSAALTRIGLTLLTHLPLALTVRRWLPVYISGHVGPRQSLSALLLYTVFTTLLTQFYVGGEFRTQGVVGLLILLTQIYTVTVLYLQTALFRKSAMQQELDTMNLLWHQQKAQYQVSKETIDLINRKCHDLKHQVAAMRTMESSERREQYLREIEDSVQIYDSMVKTGNETLDTVLTEKSLLCEANRITVNCVADGAQLSFMDPVDLYTIFGNALDNAMEGVRAFEDEQMRVIDVLIHVRQQFLVISVTNPLRETLSFHEGLPVSIKPKDGYHGYGMRSIRHTVRKYGGEMTVETENGCFSLRLMIPLPEERDETA